MSYILEALKKSDKERQKEEIPDLRADHLLLSSRRGARRQTGWRFQGFVVVGAMGAGLLLWWWLSVNHQPSSVSNVPVQTAPVVSGRESLSLQSAAIPEQTIQAKSVVQEPKAKNALKPAPKSAGAVSSVVTQQQTLATEAVLVSLPAKQEQLFLPPLIEELPVSVRAEIPELSFAGHVYSHAASKRLIIINNRIIREGEFISNGLVLQEIGQEGVVLRYETSVFRVKLF